MSEGLEIWGRQQRLRRRDDRPGELATTSEALTEEDETKDLTTTTEASVEEEEETMRPSELLRRWTCRCVYGLRLFMTTMALWIE